MRKFGKRILLFLVLSVAASLLFTACTEKNAMPETDRIVSVSVDGNAAQTIVKAELTEQTLDLVGEKGKIYLSCPVGKGSGYSYFGSLGRGKSAQQCLLYRGAQNSRRRASSL